MVPLLFFLIAGVIFVRDGKISGAPKSQLAAKNIASAESSIPMPFAEMTVPHLRGRTFVSTLGEMQHLVQAANYSSYLSYYESDGYRINGLLTVPAGEMPEGGWPAIIFVHGYIPPAEYQTLERYGEYIDYLASNGYVVFKIDLRGHGESEGEPGGGYFGSDYIVDTLNARAALASSDFVNAEKIGLWGHSMAGNVLLRSVAARPEIPAAVIWGGAVFTYTDREKYGIQDASFSPSHLNAQRLNRRGELYEKYGSPTTESVFWRQVIPTNYLSDLKGAIALHHAIDDDVVSVGYSRDLAVLLGNASVPHEFHEYQNGGHNISGDSFALAMQRTVAFFDTHLK